MTLRRYLKTFLMAFLACGLLTSCQGDNTSSTLDLDNESATNAEPVEKTLLSEPLTYDVEGAQRAGHLARLNPLTVAPMLLLLPDERGIDAWMLNHAARFAQLGYVTVIPDIDHVTVDARDRDLVAEVEAAMAAARERVGYLAPPRVGVVGWSIGGWHALTLTRRMNLDVTVICYGPLLSRVEGLLGVREPILGIFGGEDEQVPMGDIVAFEDSMKMISGRFEAHVFSVEGHDFMRFPVDDANRREAELQIVGWLDRYMPPGH